MKTCECGNKKFICRFKYYGNAIVDSEDNWEKDVGVDDAKFYGPYTCTKCRKEYPELTDLCF